MKKLIISLSLFALTILSSCEKETPEQVKQEVEGQKASYEVNGTQKESSGNGVILTYAKASNSLQIMLMESDLKNGCILKLYSVGVKEYKIGVGSGNPDPFETTGSYKKENKILNNINCNQSNEEGKIKITKFDLTNKIISGTFYYDVCDGNGNTFEIRKGNFEDIKFIVN